MRKISEKVDRALKLLGDRYAPLSSKPPSTGNFRREWPVKFMAGDRPCAAKYFRNQRRIRIELFKKAQVALTVMLEPEEGRLFVCPPGAKKQSREEFSWETDAELVALLERCVESCPL